jgi:glycosyltransferase involved in cell wall biosynthesis
MKIKIAVLLTTYNGEKYIEQQLDSIIFQQGNFSIDIFISDDGSLDNTLHLCKKKKYKKNIKKIYNVNFKSFSKNFIYLVNKIPKYYDFYAFSDQDDIWLKNKFKIATKILNQNYSLYCSRTILVNNELKIIGCSPIFKKKPSFENALVQSIAGGNTMVFKKKIFKSLFKLKLNDCPSHDWMTYILTTGIGEKVFYDKNSQVLYRQHKNNLVGSNNEIITKIVRLKLLLKGRFRAWQKFHTRILNKNFNILNPDNKKIFLHLKKLRNNRIYLIKCLLQNNLKIYRQTFLGQIALRLSLFLKLI